MNFRSCFHLAALVCLLVVGLVQPVTAADEDKAASLYEKALQEFDKKEFSTAEIYLKNALVEAPEFLAAHVLLGRAYLQKGDGAQAEKELKIAQRLGADQSVVVLLLAEAYEKQIKYKQLLKEIYPANFKPELNAEIQDKRGNAYLEEGQPDQALLTYREAERSNPNATAPLLGQASALIAMGELDKAEGLVSRALDIDPKAPDAWYTKGLIAHGRGRLKEALEQYTHALELDPENYSIRVARAGVSMDLGLNKEALSDLEVLYKDDSFDPQVPYLLGVVQARLGDIEASKKAMDKANQILTAIPAEVVNSHGATLLLASLVEYSLGEWEKARDHLEDYVVRYPNNPGGRKLLGSILFEKGDYDRAIMILEPALKQIPNDPKLLTTLGTAYLKKNRSLKALELLDRAVSVGGNVEARTQHGLAELAIGKEEAGIEQLSEVFLGSDKARQAGMALVMEHLRRGENRSAAKVAKLLSERNPGNPNLLNLLAGAETAVGDLDSARAHYREILEKDPDFVVAGINLAKIDRAEGKLAQARERLAGLAARHGGNVLVLVEQAKLEEAGGNREAAINLAEKAVALDESALANQLYLGELYLRAQAYEKFDRLAQKLERVFPRNQPVMELVGRGYLARGQMDKARNEFRNMSKEAGYDAQALARVAELSRAAGDLDWAAWSLVKALEVKPHWFEARLQLGDIYLQEGKQQEAADVVTYLMSNFPDNPGSRRLAGDLAQSQGRMDQAIGEYRQALQKGGGQDVVLRVYRAYLYKGETEAAVQFLKNHLPKGSVLKDSPTLAAALAEGYLQMGDAEAAQKIYEQLVAAGLKNAGMFNNLAMIYLHNNDPRALAMARQAHALAPERPKISDTLGWLLVKAGKPAEGLRHLRNANLRNSADRGVRYHIATALVDLGRADEAGRELRDILLDGTDFPDRAAAEALLKRLGAPK